MTKRILVTGATGYVGGRLVPRLVELGDHVRILVRDPESVAMRPWREHVEIVQGDLSRPATLEQALEGIDTAYYLVHSLGTGDDFHVRDRQNALNFARAAQITRLKHCICLGGLVPKEGNPSRHLASRAKVGEIL